MELILYKDNGENKFVFTRNATHSGHWVTTTSNGLSSEVLSGFDYMTESEVEKEFGFYEPVGEVGWQLG